LEQQGQVYKVAGVDENATAPQNSKEKKRKIGKNGDDVGDIHMGLEHRICTDTVQSSKQPKKPRVNTAVYVTNIPLDADADEINHVFKTCGVIAEEIDSGKPRIKMYEDESGKFKGDALIVYFRPESVKLAIQMLDDSDFRLGEAVVGKMKVTEASYEYKKQQDAPVKKVKGDQKKIIKRTQKLNRCVHLTIRHYLFHLTGAQ
jgi:HIV Tat-specific factor 1